MSLDGMSEPFQAQPARGKLTRRDIDILRQLTTGKSNKLIAKELAIAEATVKVHVKRLLWKIQVTNRTQAALWGLAMGHVTLYDVSKHHSG